ncbi:MAG: tetratricopeptide repeat protein [Gemmatimonadota bacterium]
MRANQHRCLRLAIIAAVAAVVVVGGAVESAAAQEPERPGAAASADTAAVLLDVAIGLEEAGRSELAAELYRLILDRYPESPAADEVRRRFAERGAVEPEEDGRVELMVWSTLYGLWLGVAVPGALSADGPEPYGLGLLLGGPAGLIASHLYTRDRFIGDGDASVLTFAGTWGTWQGLGWQMALDLGVGTETRCVTDVDPPQCFETTEDSQEEFFTAGIVGGLAGLATGGAVLARTGGGVAPGTATMINFGALWGTYWGFSLSVIADVEDGDETLTWALLAGDAGLLATALAAPGWRLTRGRARMINIAGIAGLVGGLGLDLLIQPGDADVAVAIPMLSSIAGLAIGVASTSAGAEEVRPADGPSSGASGALLEWRRGAGLGLGVPVPTPTLLAPSPSPMWMRAGAPGSRDRLGLRLRVLHARF